MKKITLLAFGAIALAACNNNGYNITGTTTGSMEGKTAYLVNTNTGEKADSCIVADSTFTFKGEFAEPEVMRVQVGNANGVVLVEPGSDITVDLTNRPATVTDNGGINDKSATFDKNMNEKNNELSAQFIELRKKLQNGEITQEELMKTAMDFNNTLSGMYTAGIAENKDNILGAYLLARFANQYEYLAELDSVMQTVKYSGKMESIAKHRSNLEKKEATKEGKMFVDFKGKNIDGGDSSLSDYVGKGKFVIADFWASWCGPCRAEIPNLIALNKEFGGDNFVVIGINVWDQEQKFKESLKSEGIDYPQIYVPTNGDVDATALYGINGIPQIILFGPDGTILKRDLRGEGIKNAVKEAMGK